MPTYPLGKIMALVESTNTDTVPMKVAYAYEDLVFMEHNAFLLQFTDDENELLLHKNVSAEPDAIANSILALKATAEAQEIRIQEGDLYSIEQADDNKVRLEFIKSEAEQTP